MANFQLPSGPIEDSFKISLFVNIIDDSSDTTTYYISSSVTVKKNDMFFNKLTDNLINSDTAVNELKNQSVSSISSFIISFTTTLDYHQNSSLNVG